MKTRLLAMPVILILILTLFVSACGSNVDDYYADSSYLDTINNEDIANVLESEPVTLLEADYAKFPILHINSYYDPFAQLRDSWLDGTLSLSGVYENMTFEDVDVRVRGRGHSTWWRGPDKRPLRIRFSEARPVLSDYPARDWILLADHFDRSLLRNYAALTLGSKLCGLSFTPVPHHVQLYVNDEYMGVYLLTDERNVGPGRMDLYWDEDPATSDYFFEKDVRAYQRRILDESFIIVNGLQYNLRYPNDLTSEHVDYIRTYIEAVSYAIRYQSFDEILTLIDLGSFIDFYIVQELFKDKDAKHTSIFMYITGINDERRLFKGPIWDYDHSAGNAPNQPMGYGPVGIYVAEINYWYRYLLQRPEFFEAVQIRWNDVKDNQIAETIEHVRQIAIHYQDEFERNFDRHLIMGIPSGVPATAEILEIENFMGHVEHLLSWLTTRANWLDDYFNNRVDYDPMAVVFEHFINSPISIVKNDELHVFDTAGPIRLVNIIVAPINELADIFDANFSYDDTSNTLELSKQDVVITQQVGDTIVYVNGQSFDMGMPSSLFIQEHLYFCLMLTISAFGYEVIWNDFTETIYIVDSRMQIG